MKCTNCGKVVYKTQKFCSQCGAKLESEEVVTQENLVEKTKNENPEIVEIKQTDSVVENKEKTPVVKKTQGFGIAGFVLGLVGLVSTTFIPSLLGLIFSAIALKKYDVEKNKNKGFATAGLVLSIIALAFFVLFLIEEILALIYLY